MVSPFSPAIDELVSCLAVDVVIIEFDFLNLQVKELWDAGAICTSYAKTLTIPLKVS